jgi:hypothetical protein
VLGREPGSDQPGLSSKMISDAAPSSGGGQPYGSGSEDSCGHIGNGGKSRGELGSATFTDYLIDPENTAESCSKSGENSSTTSS